jgi:rhodanese-related sulfurtransferase
MIAMLKKLLGLGKSVDFKELMKNGAQIIDVRTPGEFKTGHIKGAVNIPLQQFQIWMSKIKKDKPVITCCASGMRSASAKNMLQSAGFKDVHNGGGWAGLNRKLH